MLPRWPSRRSGFHALSRQAVHVTDSAFKMLGKQCLACFASALLSCCLHCKLQDQLLNLLGRECLTQHELLTRHTEHLISM